ncbi:DMT family transporter [Idiomarina sp.]|uniref:DMT family transporter n=1 Tax=Idiomarina sp. TaxID=1874361 RepID=UPI001D8972D0|nr:DMT family transporter [Idiomarina sp.]MCJ8316585.1 DMT family transporter [Idiomarina sp.]NQZ15309.1 DMT family transporter [Idiomarina sp.]
MAADKIAFIYALIAVLLWSTVATAFKITLEYMTPLQMVTAASVVSFAVLSLVCVIQKKSHLLLLELRKMPLYYVLMGLINPLIYYLVLFQAYKLLPASEAQPLNYTWAIALSIMAALFLKQHIRRRDWVACALGYFGVLVIATRGDLLGLSFSNPWGVLLALISTFLWAGYWILNTRRNADSVVSLVLSFGLALPILIIASFVWSDWSNIPWQGWAAVSYVGLFEMGITFLFWLKAMKTATNTALISNLIFISPFISLLLLSAIIGETIYVSTIVGLALIITGLLVQRLHFKKKLKP